MGLVAAFRLNRIHRAISKPGTARPTLPDRWGVLSPSTPTSRPTTSWALLAHRTTRPRRSSRRRTNMPTSLAAWNAYPRIWERCSGARSPKALRSRFSRSRSINPCEQAWWPTDCNALALVCALGDVSACLIRARATSGSGWWSTRATPAYSSLRSTASSTASGRSTTPIRLPMNQGCSTVTSGSWHVTDPATNRPIRAAVPPRTSVFTQRDVREISWRLAAPARPGRS